MDGSAGKSVIWKVIVKWWLTLTHTGSSFYCLCLWPISTFFVSFFKVFLTDTFTCPILGHWYHRFRFLVMSALSFCLINIVEVNLAYAPRDPPLMLHVTNLWTTFSFTFFRLGSILALLCWNISTQDHPQGLQLYNLALRVLLLFGTFITNSCLI